ncbi:MAG: hypothetical protein P4L50_04360 [Anaerolineaceae bacterium]|nr:hypothetical protein [Anaerolineaceae bacterium]
MHEEKRAINWVVFLKQKCANSTIFQERETKIRKWIEHNGGHPELCPEKLVLLDEDSIRTTMKYEIASERIRKFVKEKNHKRNDK